MSAEKEVAAELHEELRQLRERSRRDDEGVTIHMCPPSDSGVLPCCGRTPFEVLMDRITTKPEFVNCDRLKLQQELAAAREQLQREETERCEAQGAIEGLEKQNQMLGAQLERMREQHQGCFSKTAHDHLCGVITSLEHQLAQLRGQPFPAPSEEAGPAAESFDVYRVLPAPAPSTAGSPTVTYSIDSGDHCPNEKAVGEDACARDEHSDRLCGPSKQMRCIRCGRHRKLRSGEVIPGSYVHCPDHPKYGEVL